MLLIYLQALKLRGSRGLVKAEWEREMVLEDELTKLGSSRMPYCQFGVYPP